MNEAFALLRRDAELFCTPCNAMTTHHILDVRSVRSGAVKMAHDIRLCEACGWQTVSEPTLLTTWNPWSPSSAES